MKKIISYLSLLISDSKIRFNVGILFGLVLNSFYIVYNLIYGIKYGNVWFITVSAYYTLIVGLRYFSIGRETVGANASAERTLGILVLSLSFPMTGMIIYTVITNSARTFPKSSLPVFAGYAIFSILRAVFGLLASERESKVPRRMAHLIRLSLALMSLFNLQTSLFTYLGVKRVIALTLNFITGGAVSLSMLALAATGGKRV